ncbi:MAG: hypothetical protein HYU03_04770 [Thaumarchaeota archaeon]|nr:hypothetical protein [Nitrososphaerota archaeon]MBI3116957.1 hypothetical protein [Nitrososphaerota archaeon]MCS4539988.1 hypothetical protein [Nitrososphaerota archaeon]
MTSAVEEAIKVLEGFESELEKIKQEAVEAKKSLLRKVSEEGETAKAEALAKAQAVADERIRRARNEADGEASSIIARGDQSVKTLEERISKKNKEAVELVVKELLGD